MKGSDADSCVLLMYTMLGVSLGVSSMRMKDGCDSKAIYLGAIHEMGIMSVNLKNKTDDMVHLSKNEVATVWPVNQLASMSNGGCG